MLTSLVLPLLLAQEIQIFIQRERYNINKPHTKSIFIRQQVDVFFAHASPMNLNAHTDMLLRKLSRLGLYIGQ